VTGTRVVVTAPPPTAGKLARALRDAGADVIEATVVKIVDPESWDQLDAALARLAGGAYDWIVFTSGNAVRRVLDRLDATEGRVALERAKAAAVGSATAAALNSQGVDVDLVPEEFTGRVLAASLGRGPGMLLLPRVADGPKAIVSALESAGWTVDDVAAYRNLPGSGQPGAARVQAGDFDVVTFTSGSAVRNFLDLFGEPSALDLAEDSSPAKTVACIGPSTSDTARSLGVRVDIVPDEHSVSGLVGELRAALDASRGAT
jgi:uroporphyrinogen III methyltransferase/synthase